MLEEQVASIFKVGDTGFSTILLMNYLLHSVAFQNSVILLVNTFPLEQWNTKDTRIELQ
jgi:hypothetical protein